MKELETAHCPFTSKARITKKSLQRPKLSLEHEHFGLCVTHTQTEKSNMLSLYVVETGSSFSRHRSVRLKAKLYFITDVA